MVDKNDMQRGGDAAQDVGRGLNDLRNGDPNALAHDVADGMRALGIPGSDLIDDIVGFADGVLPEVSYDMFWGEASAAEKGLDLVEGMADDFVGKALGGIPIVGGIAKEGLDRAEKLGEQQLGGTASGWRLFTFRLAEELSRPWILYITMVRAEVAPKPVTPEAGGLLTKAAGFIQEVKSGGAGALLNDAKNALLDATGINAPTDSSPADEEPQKGVPLDPKKFLNQPVSISFARWNRDSNGMRRGKAPIVERWLTGFVSEFEDLGSTDVPQGATPTAGQMGNRFVNITVVPAMWKLNLRRDCRIFQNMNAIEIVREVFKTASVYQGQSAALGSAVGLLSESAGNAIGNLTDGVHLIPPPGLAGDWTPKRTMCVQYNESDLDFVHRLLESEGISYSFDCKKRSERVILFEDPVALATITTVDHEPIPFVRPDEITFAHPTPSDTGRWDDRSVNNQHKGQPEVFWKLGARQRLQPKKIQLRDYNRNLAQPVPAGADGAKLPFLQDVTSDAATRPARAYEAKIPGIAAQGVQYGFPLALVPPPDSKDEIPSAQPFAAAPNAVADPAVRLRDAYRTQEELITGEGNVSTIRPGIIVEVKGYVDYRTTVPGGWQPLTQAPPTLTGSTIPGQRAADLASLQQWRAINDQADAQRAGRDAAYGGVTRLLVLRSEHFGHDNSLDSQAQYSSPQGIESGKTSWSSGWSDLNGNPKQRSTQQVGQPGIPATKYTPALGGPPPPPSGPGPAWEQNTVDGLNRAQQWMNPTASPIELLVPGGASVRDRRSAFAGPGAPPSPLLGFSQPTAGAPGSNTPLASVTYYNRVQAIVLDGSPNAVNTVRPLPRTPKPRIHGLQTALVVNHENHFSDDLEHQFNLGLGYCVKVHFHWDRRGDGLLSKRKSSCFVPVAALQAGQSESSRPDWGTTFIPRAGAEVVVGFIDGDPDRPIVLGCVPNGHKSPATVSLPQPTVRRSDASGGPDKPVIMDDPKPSESITLNESLHAHRGVIKSQSEPFAAGTGNWIVFDDNARQEWIQVRAQKQLMKDVVAEYTINVGYAEDAPSGDVHRQINAVQLDQKESIAGHVVTTVGHDRTETVKHHSVTKIAHGDHTMHITTGDDTLNIERGRVTTIHGYDWLSVGPDAVPDKDEKPDGSPRMRREMTLFGSQLVKLKKREDPLDEGNETLLVRKSKTDTIGGKLSVETKGGLSLSLADPKGTNSNSPSEISSGEPDNPNGDRGLLSVRSNDEITMSSAGLVVIRSDHNEVRLEAHDAAIISTQKDKLALTVQDTQDFNGVILAGTENSVGVKGVLVTVGGPTEQKTTTLRLDDDGISIVVKGTDDSSIVIKKSAAITITGDYLRMFAAEKINVAGAVQFKPAQGG